MIKALSLLLVSGAVALAACSSSKSSSTSAGACSSYVAALRDTAKRCKNNSSSPEQEAAAVARQSTLCNNVLNAPGNGVAASSVQSCADALRSTCDTPEVCEGLSSTVGTLADGTACGEDGQCLGGDCRKDDGSNGCGKCAQRIALGGVCGTGTGKCVRGSSCTSKGGSGGSTCVATVKVAEGEVCYDPTKPSSTSSSCATGLTCKIGSGGGTAPIKCVKRGGTGEACTQEGDCLTELGCIAGKCGPLLAAGAACTSSSSCALGACSKTTKLCVPIEYVAAGAACDDDAQRCARGRCERGPDATAGKCIDPIADGAPCTTTTGSSTGPRCDTYATCIDGTCQLFDPATCK